MKKKRFLSALLAFVVLLTTILSGKVLRVKAADSTTTFGLISYQNAILLGNSAYDESMTYYGTTSRISLNGNQSRRITNGEIGSNFSHVAFCIEPTEETPGVTGTSFTGEALDQMVGESYNSGSGTRTFSNDQYRRIQNLIKYGYPGGSEYWSNHGVGDLFVQQMVTQMAVWYVTSDNWGLYPDRVAATLNGTGGFRVNTDVYTDSLGGDEMLKEMFRIATDSTYEPNILNPEVTVTANGSNYSSGTFASSWTVTVSGAGHGMYLSATGLPQNYTLKVDGAVKSFDGNGQCWVMTTGYAGYPTSGTFGVTIESAEPSTIVLKATAPKAEEAGSVYFGLTSQQKVISADMFFDKEEDDASVTSSLPTVKVDMFKKDAYSNSNLSGIYFELKADSTDGQTIKGENGSWQTDSTGWLEFIPDWDRDYYIREVDNGKYRDEVAKFTSNGVEIDFSLNEYIKIRCDWDSKHLYINDQDAGELYYNQAIDCYLTASDPNNGETYYVQVYNNRPDIDLTFSKVDEEDTSLTGPQFTLYDGNQHAITVATANNGIVKFNHTYAWDEQYFIAETMNQGYQEELTFKVGNTSVAKSLGELIPVKFLWNEFVVEIDGIQYDLTFVNDGLVKSSESFTFINKERGRIEITKLDEDDNSIVLPGVTFGLYDDANCSILLATAITNDNGIATFGDLTLERFYYVKEIATISPYILDDSITIMEAYKDSADGYDDTECEYIFRDYVTNQKQKMRFSVEKVGTVVTGLNESTGEFIWEQKNIEGVTFGIFTDAECTTPLQVNGSDYTITTNANGVATSVALELGTYYIKEVAINNQDINSLLLNTEVKSVSASYDATQGEVIETEVSFTDVPQKLVLNVKKVDENNSPLKDAEFTIYASSDILDYQGNVIAASGKKLKVLTTDTNGSISYSNIPCGMYRVLETKAPYGFVDEQKEVTLGSSFDAAKGETVELNSLIRNTKQKNRIRIQKVGEVLVRIDNGTFIYEERIVGGAKFNVIDENGNVVDTITTVDDDWAYSKELDYGTYKVQEIQSLYGHYIGTDDTNTVIFDYDSSKTTEVVVKDVEKKNERQKIYLTIYKVDEDDNELKLDGAHFDLYTVDAIKDYKGNILIEANSKIESGVTVDGTLAFKSDIVPGKYYALETKSPQGYTLGAKATEKIEFDATYQVASQRLEYIELETTVTNRKIKLMITKHDAVGLLQDQLAGAKLHIEDLDGNIIYTFTTKDEPEDISGILEPGTYILVEDEAPEGFLIAEPVTIVIEDKEELQSFDMYDEADIGGLTFAYDDSGDWLRAPGIAADVPNTGDATNAMFYLVLMIGAFLTLILLKKNRKVTITALVFTMIVLLVPLTAEAAEEDTTKVVQEYTSTDKEKKYDFDSVISVDGKEYELSDVKYEVTPKNTTETKTFTQTKESEAIYDNKSADGLFDKSIAVDGEEYTYVKADKVALDPITNRNEVYAEAVKYIGYVGIGEVAESTRTNAYDPILKTNKVVTLPKTETVIDKTYWEDCTITATVKLSGPYYRVEDTIVAYDENDPQLAGHEEYILQGLGLDTSLYIIDSFAWDGDIYEVDGAKYRSVIATGKRQVNDYTVTYSGTVELEDITNAYKYVATYERKVEVAADTQVFDIKATATYSPKVVPEMSVDEGNTKDDSNKTMFRTLIIGLTLAIVIALIIVFLFFLRRRKNTIEATTYKRDDETRRF